MRDVLSTLRKYNRKVRYYKTVFRLIMETCMIHTIEGKYSTNCCHPLNYRISIENSVDAHHCHYLYPPPNSYCVPMDIES